MKNALSLFFSFALFHKGSRQIGQLSSTNVFPPTRRKSLWRLSGKQRRNCGPAKLINYAGANRRRAFLPYIILHVCLLSLSLSLSFPRAPARSTLLKSSLSFLWGKIFQRENNFSRIIIIRITKFLKDTPNYSPSLFHLVKKPNESLEFNINKRSEHARK